MDKKYFNIPNNSNNHFTNSIYYTAVVHSSTGFGDITPNTNITKMITKMITTAHIFCVFIVIASVILLHDK